MLSYEARRLWPYFGSATENCGDSSIGGTQDSGRSGRNSSPRTISTDTTLEIVYRNVQRTGKSRPGGRNSALSPYRRRRQCGARRRRPCPSREKGR
ncbi:hypothetical protein DBV15_11208 [Temnothorax longispinosus]|uniref:Uncharacterized protein n=1 Tax=Temnothorax longispinosus TaxID=300112 RepID=A0A4S2LCR9_9HYME|nr:hypothetical protein DBV15_11208 [Temnothorax longispinosus]